jgi:hypothetical protein
VTASGSRARLDAWRDRRTAPLEFRLDGARYSVPEHPARVWVLAVLSDEPADLLLDVLPEPVAEALWDDATDPDSDVTPVLLHRIGQALLARVAGRPWWAATQLVAELVDQWDVFIAVARDRGLGDPLEWPLDELCAWVYLRITQGAKPEERARIDAALAAPPPDTGDGDGDGDEDAPPSGWDEAGGWMALAAQHGGGGAPT